jgi:hypothetical protein
MGRALGGGAGGRPGLAGGARPGGARGAGHLGHADKTSNRTRSATTPEYAAAPGCMSQSHGAAAVNRALRGALQQAMGA